MALQIKVPNMACSACSETISKAIKAIDPNATVQADTKTKIVLVETHKSETAIKEAFPRCWLLTSLIINIHTTGVAGLI